ncbi:MAG: molybdopterin-dependent oxidoreductase, partial [Alphaproteobacteria bacterium]|nr:molybdopterin-dependent oxidoreductase [Alphaproteobacteria bacterium]
MAGHPSIAKHPSLDEWIELVDDGRIVLHTGKVELGQRIYTALAIIAAEELDVDYDRIDVRRAETGVDPNEGMTTGSMSMQHSGNAIRMASATARRHLLEMAAEKLRVEVAGLEVEDGLIQSRDSNQSITYWDLMAGKTFGTAVDENVSVKAPQDHTRVGKRVTPKGMVEIVTGRMTYLHDMKMPGMLHARLLRPPHYFAKLKNLDDAVVERLSGDGVTVVRDGSFIAVAAADEYAAVKAADRLKGAAEWHQGAGLRTAELFESLTENERLSFPVAAGGAPVEAPVPDLAPPPADAAITLSARYEKPYIMHGSMGPSAGCALYESGRLTVWSHSQGIYPLRGALARALDMAEKDIHLIFMPAAGCYGHNGADDAAFEAAVIARAIPDAPILLKWTRDDEHAWEPYGSATVCELRGSLDGEGKIIDWSHESYGDTFMGRPVPGRYDSPESRLVSTHFLETALDWPVAAPAMGAHIGIHRNLEPIYAIPKPRLVKNLVRGLP